MTSPAPVLQEARLFDGYAPLPGTYDEMFDAEGRPRPHTTGAMRVLGGLTPEEFARCQTLAELALVNQGVTFSVYADDRGTEKIFPVCMIPRVIAARDWERIERGLMQRLAALEAFLDDVYGPQHILRDKAIPSELVLGSKQFLPKLRHLSPPGTVRIHIAGIDLIRSPDGVLRVLEDNVRTPSGVSYVLENRLVSKRVFHRAIDQAGVRRVDHYPTQLVETLRSVSPVPAEDSEIVLLTPGRFNSAYFEHSFLGRMMGIPLVEAGDLLVDGDTVYVRTTKGPRRVHVIYRRTDDAFLDPEFFRADSVIGVPGLMRAWAAGRVALVNAPGNGVVDDEAVYPYVPAMIRFYLGEEPLLEQVRTYVCAEPGDCAYVADHLAELVVKVVDEAGGYGMLMGPQASTSERQDFRQRILAEPRRFIAQHRVDFSTGPTWVPGRQRLEPRRLDLRPYVLTRQVGPAGRSYAQSWVLPGGLTRVALVEGSYVVNSSQGGGSKDTWVQKD